MAKRQSRTKNNHSKKRVKKVKRVKRTLRNKNQKGSGFFKKLGTKSKEAARIVGSKTKEGFKVVGYHGSLKKLQMNKNNFENKSLNQNELFDTQEELNDDILKIDYQHSFDENLSDTKYQLLSSEISINNFFINSKITSSVLDSSVALCFERL